MAANPGGGTVTLNSTVVGSTSDSTELTLEGVVSLAANGIIGINCAELSAMANDSFQYPRITSTQVSSFTSVAPS